MPEQLLAHPDADPEHDDQEPKAGPRSAIDLKALRALKQSRTDVEALDLTAERLRHLGDAFTAAADRARATMDRYADREDADGLHPVRGRPAGAPPAAAGTAPGPEGRPLRASDAAHPVRRCAPTMPCTEPPPT
ncbi:hypothetical protein [Streptomyces scopuliridis]|uniref:hypothetical protein n=1 Tax=Streptomyces scopuliridis TaxID=452529 RepID=UPI00369A81BD